VPRSLADGLQKPSRGPRKGSAKTAGRRSIHSARVSEAKVIPPGGGEVVGDSPERRVEILSDHDALNATWSRFGPRLEGADLHVHRRHTDLFYVLAGELTVMLGAEGESVAVPAGTLARLPPLVVHGFRNGTDAELRYLNFHAPGQRFAEYLRALRDGRTLSYDQEPPPPDGGRPAAEAVIGGAELLADGVSLLADVDEIGVSEERRDPGSPSQPPHIHRDHVESISVLEGEIALTAGDRDLHAQAGSWLQVPPGVPHALSFPGSEPARLLNVHTPNCGFGAFLRTLHDRGDEVAAASRAAFDRQPAPQPRSAAVSRRSSKP
jgi:mannose-6-phosphate isomerase-like protein (cupin superfamily)